MDSDLEYQVFKLHQTANTHFRSGAFCCENLVLLSPLYALVIGGLWNADHKLGLASAFSLAAYGAYGVKEYFASRRLNSKADSLKQETSEIVPS